MLHGPRRIQLEGANITPPLAISRRPLGFCNRCLRNSAFKKKSLSSIRHATVTGMSPRRLGAGGP